MSGKRRDNRNRILHEGEYQRADGRHRYRYIDENGQENNVYSWSTPKRNWASNWSKQHNTSSSTTKDIKRPFVKTQGKPDKPLKLSSSKIE